MGRMVDAVNSGDRREMLDALLMKIAETLDKTDSGRDVGALAIKFVDVLDRRDESEPDNGKHKKEAVEVTAFETITKRRSERRKTAQA